MFPMERVKCLQEASRRRRRRRGASKTKIIASLEMYKTRRRQPDSRKTMSPIHYATTSTRAYQVNLNLRLITKLIPVLLLLSLSLSHWTHCLIQVPNRHTVASIPGDLVLGILVPVHERPSPKQAQTRTCGAVREQYGIQRVEAAFKTIDSINADPNILPNITLGIEIRDSCWHSPIALEQSIEFIRDAMAASEQSTTALAGLAMSHQTITTAGGSLPTSAASLGQSTALRSLRPNGKQATTSSSSSSSDSQQAPSNSTTGHHQQQHICAPYLKQQLQLQQASKKIKNLVGVVGPASSGDTVQVQNLLQLFNMPQVGYSATSRDLSNKNFFKYFLRVVPSDKLQAQVLIDLMLAHNWTYITVVYTEGSYGSSLMNAFRERAQEVGICFATLESMPPNADDAKFDELIEAIQNHRNARVVICMCEGRTIGRLFAGFKRQNVSNEYLVVGSDGWSDRFDVVEQQEEIALGGISVRIHSAYVHDFDDYYFALNPHNNHRNPWFAEFWEQRFQCNLDYGAQQGAGSSSSSHSAPPSQTQSQRPPSFIRPPSAKVYNRTCTGRESLRQNHKQDAKMAFVQKSIITMALGLDSMQRSLCGSHRPGLCPEMLPVNGSIFLQHLMNVSFSFLDEEVYFDEQGDPPGKYEILNFRRKVQPPIQTLENSATDDDFQDSSSTLLGNRPQEGSPQDHQDKNRPPNYNSYSTLKVYRAQDQAAKQQQRQLSKRRIKGQPTQTRPESQQEPARPADYSATMGYEYVHVGSWKSSDGLSLFGEIQWPSRTTIYHHYPSLSGGPPSGQAPAGPGEVTDSANSNSDPNLNQVQDNNNNISSQFPNLGLGRQATQSQSGDTLGLAGGLGGYFAPPSEQQFGQNKTVSSFKVPAPKSVCALPCAKGHAKKIQSDSVRCCWVCVPCRPHEYLSDEFKCMACEKGWWPNADQAGCDQIPIESFDWRSLEAMAAAAIALLGLALTLATGAVFIKHNNTPVVKSTTRELSYMILFSMLLCYITTFFLIARPTATTCFMTRILPGFSFAMLYGALVTKTNRIARILAGSKKKIITRRPYFMSATAQVLITWLIVLMECAIIVAMLVKEPADKTHEYPSDERVVLVCNTTTMGIMAPLGFDFFLIAMCTLYAFKTRNVPENFNEAKFIGFTMYTTLVIWIAFVVIYLSSDHKVTTLSLCISFSALFALFLLFFPRCYIILFKPEKNNRSYFTTIKNVRCHIGYQLGGSGSGSANSAANTANNNAANEKTTNSINSHQHSTHHQEQPFLVPSATLGANSKLAHFEEQLQRQLNEQDFNFLDAFDSQDELELNCQEGSETAATDRHQRKRGRTSGCRVAPVPAAPQIERQPLGGHQERLAQGRPSLIVSQLDHKLTPQQNNGAGATTGTQQEPNRPASDHGKSLTRCKRRINSDATTATLFQSDSVASQATPQPTGSDSKGPGGRPVSEAAQQNNSPNGVPASSLRHLLGQIRLAFARRSQRKESDKTAVIQQHLRAIRHAENLDRQTHFRRSQVQRLVQRFDSSATGAAAAWSQHQHQLHQSNKLSQQTLTMLSQEQQKQLASNLHQHNPTVSFGQQFREFIGDQQNDDFRTLVASEEARKLLAAMSQLLGPENLWRLANVLSRYSKQHQQLEAGAAPPPKLQSHVAIQADTPLLDLRRPADRRMALTWLRFLIQMAQKSCDSVQLVMGSVSSGVQCHEATGGGIGAGSRSARGALNNYAIARSRASLSAQQSRDYLANHESVATDGAVLSSSGMVQQHRSFTSAADSPRFSLAKKPCECQTQRGLRSSPSLDNQPTSSLDVAPPTTTSNSSSPSPSLSMPKAMTSLQKLERASAAGPPSKVDESVRVPKFDKTHRAEDAEEVEFGSDGRANELGLRMDNANSTRLAHVWASTQTQTSASDNQRAGAADEEDPIERALERITGWRQSMGPKRPDHGNCNDENQLQQRQRNSSAKVNEPGSKDERRPSKGPQRVMNLNYHHDLDELLKRASEQKRQLNNDNNKEVVLVAGDLTTDAPTRATNYNQQPSGASGQSSSQLTRQDERGASQLTAATNTTNNCHYNYNNSLDDQDQETRLHFGRERDDGQSGQRVAAEAESLMSRDNNLHGSPTSTSRPSEIINNLSPGSLRAATVALHEPAPIKLSNSSSQAACSCPTVRRGRHQASSANSSLRPPIVSCYCYGCCCRRPSSSGGPGSQPTAQEGGERRSRRSHRRACHSGRRINNMDSRPVNMSQSQSSGGLAAAQQADFPCPSGSSSMRRARCCYATSSTSPCCCNRSRHHHQPRPVSASSTMSRRQDLSANGTSTNDAGVASNKFQAASETSRLDAGQEQSNLQPH